VIERAPQASRNNLVREAHKKGLLGAVIKAFWKRKTVQELKGYKFQACGSCHQQKRENQFYATFKISKFFSLTDTLTVFQPKRSATRSWATASPASRIRARPAS
jgi:hypothetical protein